MGGGGLKKEIVSVIVFSLFSGRKKSSAENSFSSYLRRRLQVMEM